MNQTREHYIRHNSNIIKHSEPLIKHQNLLDIFRLISFHFNSPSGLDKSYEAARFVDCGMEHIQAGNEIVHVGGYQYPLVN